MASFGGFPQTVNYQTVNVSSDGGSENLLINPRGKINQANESDGVLSPYQYFCDGWKAGAAGAEIYVDSDGFRLISGSIVQIVPLDIDSGCVLRGNMDVLSGEPQIVIDGGGDAFTYAGRGVVDFEVSGDNTKFTRCILAESVGLPIYQQLSDELPPCKRFLQSVVHRIHTNNYGASANTDVIFEVEMHSAPAISVNTSGSGNGGTMHFQYDYPNKTKTKFHMNSGAAVSYVDGYIADARL